jgi:chromosome partitioning protein
MRAGKVEKILSVSKSTLLRRIEDHSLHVDKTNSGENIFHWDHIIKLNYLLKYNKAASGSRTFSICQNKGGVGKTTSVINLGTALSYIGKTLIIDLDSQANLSQAFDIYLAKNDKSVADVLDEPDDTDLIKSIIVPVTDNLHILPNNLKFENWKDAKRLDTMTPFTLKRAIRSIASNYNFILIDTPPALDIALEIALYASNYCLIPIEPHPFALDGISNILAKIKRIASNDQVANFNLKTLGCFINIFEKNPLSEQISDTINREYNAFNTVIRKSVALTQAQAFKKSIFEYDEASNAAHDYFNLTFEILERLAKEE